MRPDNQRLRSEFVAHPVATDFLDYLDANPSVYEWFIRLVLQCKQRGMSRLSGAYLRERFRHEAHLDIEYKCFKFDNDYTPLLTRLIATEEPDLADMFTFNRLAVR